MRDAFFAELKNLYKENPKVVFITGDLGYKLFDSLKAIDPDRVINFGIREAAMVGFAAGLAKEGMLPFVYSIVPFMTLRCLEQIKVDLCYNKVKVVVVGVGGGFAYGPNGPTHFGVDDMGVIGTLPNISVWTPCDPEQVKECVKQVPFLNESVYLRLGRNKEPELLNKFNLSKEKSFRTPQCLKEGKDGIILTAGFILEEVLIAVQKLEAQQIFPSVIHITELRPFPFDSIKAYLNQGPVLTVEEHVATGGLGLEVAKVIAFSGLRCVFDMASVPLQFPETCHSRSSALKWAGIDSDSIVNRFKSLMLRELR